MLILRPVAERDLDDLVGLAAQLDSMNLPSDRHFLAQRIHDSVRCFAGQTSRRGEAVYVFVLEDVVRHRCIGTSTILAQHGTPESPHYWLELSTEERTCAQLGRRFAHDKLRLRSSTDGPTEIGGLILDPGYRRHPEKCGKALSIVRFAFMAAHPDRFEREVIAEMLSPFDAPGCNRLWDAFGAHFTGLSFREADRLSATNKTFIADLFPRDPVYATLFPPAVREVIGRPNESAIAALRILEKIGFRHLNQVDPFDGGPYLGCARDAIASVRERKELVLPSLADDEPQAMREPLALLSAEGSFGFRATVVPIDDDGFPCVSKECREALGVAAGDRVAVTPLP
ncbi:MAG: arginine N-succinyltransferase [Myxococcota bacterium]|nr:arginine N-succinyltransferase [Myxococcota bacterium]